MKETKPADGLSIVSLAASIAAVVTLLFCIIPMFAFCLAPISVLCAAAAVLTGIPSLIRTAIKPELEGRGQVLSGFALLLLWGVGAWVLYQFALRHS